MQLGFLLINFYDNFNCHLSILGMLSNSPQVSCAFQKLLEFSVRFYWKKSIRRVKPFIDKAALVQGLFLRGFLIKAHSSADKALEKHT